MILSLLSFLHFGCATKIVQTDAGTKQVVSSNIPAWVLNPPKGKDEICAVGSYKMKGNISMAQQASQNRGRDELSRQILIHTKAMIKDYIEEGETGGESFTEELVTSVSKSVTKNSLSGTVATKQEMMDGSLYSLMCLQVDKFANAFDNMNQLSEKARVKLRNRAQRGFEELDAEADKIE